MASLPSPRDPLIDTRLQAMLNQRGKELVGLCLIGVGLVLALILGTYSAEDPTWMAATDAPVHNALGRAGAAIASPLTTILGRGAWGLPLSFCIWGLRLVIHQGEDLVLGRSFFAPLAVALGAVWQSSLVPGAGWALPFGLGGMFGDTVFAAVMTALPMTSFVANVMTLLTFGGAVALYLYILGCTLPELRRIGLFLVSGLVLTYAGALSLLGFSARGMGGLAVRGHDQWQHRREAKAQARAAADQALTQHQPWEEPAAPVWRQPEPDHLIDRYDHAPHPAAQPQSHAAPRAERAPAPRGAHRPAMQDPYGDPYADPYADPRQDQRHDSRMAPARAPQPAQPAQGWSNPEAPVERQGVLGRVAALGRRPEPQPEPEPVWSMPESELVEREPMLEASQAPSQEGLRARIAELMNGRSRAKPVLRFNPDQYPSRAPKAEPQVSGGRREPTMTAGAPMVPHPDAAPVAAPMPYPAPQPAPQAAAPVPPAQGYSFSHAYDYQPVPPGYPGATAPGYAPGPQAAPQPMARQQPAYEAPLLEDDEDDLYDPGYESRYEAPAPRAQAPAPEPRRAQPQPAARAPQPSRQARAEAQPSLALEPAGDDGFELPPLALLRDPALEKRRVISHDALDQNARMLESVLDDYGVRGDIISYKPGPVVTMYELEPAPGLKASRVIGLSDDIARSMSALSARVSTVPGRSVIGIELPNADRHTVVLREILATRDFGDSTMRLPLALGKDIGGEPVVANLAKMPHLLIAGTTGSGKSVAINTMILSLLYKLTPAECRLIMIDPKMLELSVYDGIPHLLSPVVTDPKKAVVALKWVVGEMEERYRKMSKMGVRNIEGYNGRVREAQAKGEMFKRTVQTGFDDETGDPVFETEEFAPEILPFIVVIVDEMADLMMVAGKEIEACIQRLAQMARASGIHLIMATQRPSVDVITGTIKANFPTRISFQVTSKIDSRTILGEQGAEQLLGMGDMLYMAGGAKITRVHGPFCSDSEVEEVVAHLKSFGPPDYVGGVVEGPEGDREADIDAVLGLGGGDSGGEDALYDQAVAIVARDRKCSTSYIQRKLGIGYNKAARLVEQMESEGVVSTANHVGKREILVPESH
ncbi:DNA translocase FtsK 4TM domain-containing protein [Pararhodobacter sp. CCB-MM2]|uniref:DNA translocase FtsK n=1 Tax=Pararhodobacter sp. CCB-MM2 TaxID=1786003 RepID=UPI0008318C47|nr:DNA translocase FtsK 4TM domain-containing protein [Pararhodobacter sp. CCB-MM2]